MSFWNTLITRWSASLLVLMAPLAAGAQAFPAKPVTLVVPYAASGLTDALARGLAQRLAEQWKQPVVVDNRPGGGTVIGTAAVARAPADGHTLLLTSFGFVTSQLMVANLPYQASALEPLIMVSDAPSVLYVHPSVPADDLRGLVALMKSGKPMSFASSGNGSSPHIGAEVFAAMVGAQITHVPYRGNGPALNDLIGGQVQAMFDSLASLSQVKAGKLKVIGVAAPNRTPRAPDLPTLKEQGVAALADFSSGSWFGIFVPAGVPRELQARLHADMRAVLDTPDMRELIQRSGTEPVTMTQPAFAAYLKAELDRLGPVIRSKNIRAD
ncbi:Bug family tripartite tricarboxylate transporter substrate binding protein [Aquabacterium sp.]|uniref:Bug family tripartite tricarboxylate transporter substrate binding protein n=1 Tax=Aquabacterium sp. TaxID=1872578 RepID=UPI002B969EB8|nr:tripartite tricarboxylate transporter substrate binding protein [Aquabacterium sp.]HSW04402.1 tripartite tricarboxylate transporter substrate binding protein [Aquabacterium sp.]